MATETALRALNQQIVDSLGTGLHKIAATGLDDYLRTEVREDGWADKLVTFHPVQNSDLDRQVDTEQPVKVFDKQANSPAALSVPFGTSPPTFYLRGKRFRVTAERIITEKAVKDVDELRTYTLDLRQQVSDNLVRDMSAERDSKLVAAANIMMGGAAGATSPFWNGVQWKEYNGGMTRTNLAESTKLQKLAPSNTIAEKALLNHVTATEILKWKHNEAGGEFSQDILKNGWAVIKGLFNMDWYITIKRGIIPDDSVYYWVGEQFLGKAIQIEPPTMYVRVEAWNVEFFSYCCDGMSYGMPYVVTRADFK
jgi:hypothetical protein